MAFTNYTLAPKVYEEQGSRIEPLTVTLGTITLVNKKRTVTESRYRYVGLTEAAAKSGEATLNAIEGVTATARAATVPFWNIEVTEITVGAWEDA